MSQSAPKKQHPRPRNSTNMMKVDGEFVSASLFIQNEGLQRSRQFGSGRVCERGKLCRNVTQCGFLHYKESNHSRATAATPFAFNLTLQLSGCSNPLTHILKDEKAKMGFEELLRTPDVIHYLLPIVGRIFALLDENGDLPPDTVTEMRMMCDAWVIRSAGHLGRVSDWSADDQLHFFTHAIDLCRRDPTSPDTRRALVDASKLPLLPPAMRQEAEQLLRDTEDSFKEADTSEEDDKKKKRYVVSGMYSEALPTTRDATILPCTAAQIQRFSSDCNELRGLVVDRFIPDNLCAFHLRALFYLTRFDCMHELGKAVSLVVRNCAVAAYRKKLFDDRGQKITLHHLIFKYTQFHQWDGVLAVFRTKEVSTSHKDQFLSGDLVILWPETKSVDTDISFVGIVKKSEKSTLVLSMADIVGIWPLLKESSRFLLIRSRNFYPPTAASLTQLQRMETKMQNNMEPDLLRSLITGVGCTESPIYLQDNPRIDVGSCIALEDGTDRMQPAHNPWPTKPWNETLEKVIKEESNGEAAVLDGTQQEALQHILRNRVAVVQGTPGTGKSFVGSKLLQLLLRNRMRLKIGPIIVMSFTHHALESVFEGLAPLVVKYYVKVGLLGKPKNEAFLPYQVRTRRARCEMSSYLLRVLKHIETIRTCTTISDVIERYALEVLKLHLNEEEYTSWKIKCDEFTKKNKDALERYRNGVKSAEGKLFLRIPQSLQELRQLSLAIQDDTWYGLVDIVPYLRRSLHWPPEDMLGQICDELDEARAMRSDPLIDKNSLRYLIYSKRRNISFLSGKREKDILERCLCLFSGEINKLITLQAELGDKLTTYTEAWRCQRLPAKYNMPGIGDSDLTGSTQNALTEQDDHADEQLEQFEREEREVRRRERDIDLDLDGAEEETEAPKASFIKSPPAHEREAIVKDACQALLVAKPGARRSELLRLILRERVYTLQETVDNTVKTIDAKMMKLKPEESTMNAKIFTEYDVIGATSTKLMQFAEAIQYCGASVLVVEEAAEVLESHLMACITKSMQHVVLIGDHKQLKPKVCEYTLERNYNLAISTMERLVLCGLPCVTLTMQRRMTPEVSLLTKPYYERHNVHGDVSVHITDHPRTLSIAPPFGVCRTDGTPYRLFFVNHDGINEKAERTDNEVMSAENTFEAKLVVSIAHYLLNINKDKTITILVPYTGQQFAVFKELNAMRVPRRAKETHGDAKHCGNVGVRLSTVDDYQGEEDDIIILSLVRTEKAGFLRLDNRACVALSRARSALYIVGCGRLLSDASALWKNLEDVCTRNNCIGTRFPARCNTHPDKDLSFGTAEEYQRHLARCPATCNDSMECGHVCLSVCHANRPHPKCQKACERIGQTCVPSRMCRHPCAKVCSVECGPCVVPVECIYKTCKHVVELPCHSLSAPPPCAVLCTEEALCGHEVEAPCYTHTNETAHQKCTMECGAHMSCGHVCPSECHCGWDDDHVEAMAKCTAKRVSAAACGHMVQHACNKDVNDARCTSKCGKEVSLCRRAGPKAHCELSCGHNGPCDCKENITVKFPCGHESPELRCASDAPLPLCAAPCGAKLTCGHLCGGECGTCAERKFHSNCKVPGKMLVCGHNSRMGCTATVDMCEELCNFYCGHGKRCYKLGKAALHKCSDCPSRECMEPCAWSCPHGGCNKKCCEPCAFILSNSETVAPGCWRRCEKRLSCEHQCCGLCGETCPELCWECSKETSERSAAMREKTVHSFLYYDDESLEKIRRGESLEEDEESGELPFLIQLPCCKTHFTARELYSTLAAKEDGEVRVLTCPLCRSIILPTSFKHGGTLIRKKLLAASKVLKRVREEVRKSREYAVKDILEYLEEEEIFPRVDELDRIIKETRQCVAHESIGMSRRQQGSSPEAQNLDIAWDVFERKCLEISLPVEWTALLQYHLRVLDTALSDLVRNDKKITKNAKKLSEAAFNYTRIVRTLSERKQSDNILSFCAKNTLALIPNGECLEKSFPSARVDLNVAIFCKRMEWTVLLSHMSSLTMHKVLCNEMIESAKWFALRGVNDDEADREVQVRRYFSEKLKTGAKKKLLRYASNALGIFKGHWFECPQGHIYAIGNCGRALEEGICPDCRNKIGGRNLSLRKDNNFAGHLLLKGTAAS